MARDYTTLRAEFEKIGSRFDYIFDVLDSLNAAIKQKDAVYAREKLVRLQFVVDSIKHDTEVIIRKNNFWGK